MGLSWKIEMMNLFSDLGIHLNIIRLSSRKEDALSLLSYVMRNGRKESQHARASFQLCPWHPGTNNGIPWPPAASGAVK